MKTVFTIALSLCLTFASQAATSKIEIPARSSVEIDFPEYCLYHAQLKNLSGKNLEVSVISRESDAQIRGFGLAGRGKATVKVEETAYLKITNQTNQAVQVRLEVQEAPIPEERPKSDAESYISFTLENKSLKSIPLEIPGVMNPNLSPLSESNVCLKIGQKLYFRNGWKRYELLEVTDSILPDVKLNVSKLLQQRKEEYDLN